MANEKKNGYNPLSEAEQRAIRDMSIEDLLSSVKDTLSAPAGTSTGVPAEKPAASAAPANTATALLEREELPVIPVAEVAEEERAQAEDTRRKQASNPGEAPEFLKTKPKKEKKKRKFGVFLLVYVLAFVVVIAGGLTLLWKYLEAYELSRPERVVENFLASVDDAYWEDLVEVSSGVFATTQFENGSDIAMQCFEAVRGEEYTSRKRSGEYEDDRPVYTIRVGGADLARLTLKPNGNAGFGFHYWAADTVELLQEFVPEARTVVIQVPEEAIITLNGVQLDEGYITDSIVSPQLSPLEMQFTTELPQLAVYSVPGIYGNLELKVEDTDGTELLATFADGSLYTYGMNITETQTVTITAPADATVMLNGAVLGESYITATEEYELLSGVAEYLPGENDAQVNVYTVTGLIAQVETVTAKAADGKALAGSQSEDGSWSFGWGTETIPSAHKELVNEYMDAYLSFSSDEGNATESNWSYIQQFLLYEGDAYERCYMALDGLDWTQSYDAVLNSVDILSYAEFGEDCFVVRVNMDSTVTRPNGEVTENNTFDLVFVQDEGEWLVERMEAV